jgi:hypothetical protein
MHFKIQIEVKMSEGNKKGSGAIFFSILVSRVAAGLIPNPTGWAVRIIQTSEPYGDPRRMQLTNFSKSVSFDFSVYS